MTGITVLGPVTVGDEGDSLSPRDRVLLSVLVARRDAVVSAETLADALWGQARPTSSQKVVQGCIARLRRRLGPDAIVTGRHGYRLAVPAEDIDAGRFERLVHRARELLTVGHPDEAAYAADQSLSLWHGDPFVELEDWEPGRGETERLVQLRLQAEELRLAALLASGRHAEALPEATLRVQEDPLREHRWALLARAQYQDGRQAEALATLRLARETLAEQLGLDPGPELAQLEESVLQQDPGLVVAPVATTASRCPWPGLASYDVEDSDTFCGRETELTECLDRLHRTGFLAVVGPSGSGKSSLVRAGLAARLGREGHPVRVITPDPRPLDALAAAATGHPHGVVLVVDQCEDIFAPHVEPAVRSTFLHRVVEHARRGSTAVVLTLRADRMGELTAYPDVARLVEDGLYLLKQMGPEGLREAVERPARRAGLLLEQGLVDLLLRDVEGVPGSLPLLAHALRQTWDRREGHTLTVQGYDASGRIHGAIARSAEQVYEGATEDQRHALREILLRLVQTGPGGEPVRTSVSRDALTDEASTILVEQLVRARLVTLEEDRIEIAHEALARAWPRLQAWLADDVQGERIRHHLAAAAQGWQSMGRPASELYRGARLAAAREWRAGGDHQLSLVESEFLAASEQAHLSTLARAQDEARRQARSNRRLRVLVVGVTLLALVTAVLGGLARQQWLRGEDARAALSVEADRTRSHQLSASAIAAVGEDPALAKALAVLGAEAGPPTFQSRSALHHTIAADTIVSRITMNHHRTGRLWAQLHPSGDRVVMASETGYSPGTAVEVHDARTGELVWEWVRPEAPGYESAGVAGAEYSPDGKILASGVIWHPASAVRRGPPLESAPPPAPELVGIHLWDARTHAPLGVVDVGPCGGWPLAIAGDHLLVRTLVAPPSQHLTSDQEAALLEECRWDEGAMGTLAVDRITGESHLLMVIEALNLDLTVGHALSRDGTLAAVPDFISGEGVLVDTRDGQEVARLDGALGFDFDASGERLLALDRTNPALYHWKVVSVPDLVTLARFNGHTASSYYGRFGPQDTTVFTTGLDNRMFQWDASTGETLRQTGSVGAGPPTSADDLVLVPRPDTNGAVLVSTASAGELWSVASCRGGTGVDRMRVTADLVVVGRNCDDEVAGQLETFSHEGRTVRSWPGMSWEAFEVSPDGRYVVVRGGVAGTDPGSPLVGPLTVRDLRTGDVLVELQGFCEHTPADDLTGIAPDDPALERCGVLGEPPPFTFTAWTVRWSPDGRFIAAVDGSLAGVGVWDAASGRLVTALGTVSDAGRREWSLVYDVRFAPSSDRLVLTTMSGHLVAVDTKTWEPVVERRFDLADRTSAGPVGYAADGSLVVVKPLQQNSANTSVLLLDPDTLLLRAAWSDVAEGTVQSAAISADGTRIALATREGVVRVWDLATEALVDQADPGLGSLNAVRWIDDTSLVVLTATGHVSTVTTDTRQLLDLARSTLTRGFTQSECRTYQIEPCANLTILRGAEPAVPAELQGTYTLTWTPEEFRTAAVDHLEQAYGEIDERTLAALEVRSTLLADTYRLELRESDYTIIRGDVGNVWCTGAVSSTPGRPGRLLLGADSGSGCVEFHYAEVGWELDGNRLVLPRESFRGDYVDTLLWTGKPLTRIG